MKMHRIFKTFGPEENLQNPIIQTPHLVKEAEI